jgi:hypothetical protein
MIIHNFQLKFSNATISRPQVGYIWIKALPQPFKFRLPCDKIKDLIYTAENCHIL